MTVSPPVQPCQSWLDCSGSDFFSAAFTCIRPENESLSFCACPKTFGAWSGPGCSGEASMASDSTIAFAIVLVLQVLMAMAMIPVLLSVYRVSVWRTNAAGVSYAVSWIAIGMLISASCLSLASVVISDLGTHQAAIALRDFAVVLAAGLSLNVALTFAKVQSMRKNKSHSRRRKMVIMALLAVTLPIAFILPPVAIGNIVVFAVLGGLTLLFAVSGARLYQVSHLRFERTLGEQQKKQSESSWVLRLYAVLSDMVIADPGPRLRMLGLEDTISDESVGSRDRASRSSLRLSKLFAPSAVDQEEFSKALLTLNFLSRLACMTFWGTFSLAGSCLFCAFASTFERSIVMTEDERRAHGMLSDMFFALGLLMLCLHFVVVLVFLGSTYQRQIYKIQRSRNSRTNSKDSLFGPPGGAPRLDTLEPEARVQIAPWLIQDESLATDFDPKKIKGQSKRHLDTVNVNDDVGEKSVDTRTTIAPWVVKHDS